MNMKLMMSNMGSRIIRICFETFLEFKNNMSRSQQSKDAVPQQYEWK